MPDAVLVAHKIMLKMLGKLSICLAQIKSHKLRFSERFQLQRWFESLALGDLFQVKRIHVKPGACLSLQSHKYRSEHWIVVEGVAEVTIQDVVTKY